jgi:hypothetical protein
MEQAKTEGRKTVTLKSRITWHARKAGGLFLGARLHFPASVIYDDGSVRPTWQLGIGLLLATWHIDAIERPMKRGAL